LRPVKKNTEKLWNVYYDWHRIIAYVIKYGDAPIPLADSENTGDLDCVIAKRHEIWGNDTLFFLHTSTLEKVIWAVDWRLDTSSLEMLVDFSKLARNLIQAVKNNDFGGLNSNDFPYERTVAVNFRKNETIEFRLFKSPNNLEKVLENLRIVQAVLDYTKRGGYTLPGFIEFLSSRN
jgi:hypothetical protein